MKKGRIMVYKLKIPGAKPLFVRGESKAKAVAKIVEVESLTSEEFADAIEAGGSLFKDGDKIEAEPAPEKPQVAESEQGKK